MMGRLQIICTMDQIKEAMVCGEEVYCLGAEKVSQVAKIQGASIKGICSR